MAMCRHCNKKPMKSHCRGLCHHCHQDQDIRGQYPTRNQPQEQSEDELNRIIAEQLQCKPAWWNSEQPLEFVVRPPRHQALRRR